jgi:hypothetical protein
VIVVGFLGAADQLAVEIARRAAATGARVEMVGAAATGPDGDARLLELAAASIGHATVIRSGADALDAADLNLALRYLPDIRCVVLVRPPARLLATALADAEWAGAPLVLVGPLDADATAALDSLADTAAPARVSPIVLEPPGDSDPDGTFAGFVAALATRLDAGDPPETAFRATVSALAADPA